jgi:hypothetical protein
VRREVFVFLLEKKIFEKVTDLMFEILYPASPTPPHRLGNLHGDHFPAHGDHAIGEDPLFDDNLTFLAFLYSTAHFELHAKRRRF